MVLSLSHVSVYPRQGTFGRPGPCRLCSNTGLNLPLPLLVLPRLLEEGLGWGRSGQILLLGLPLVRRGEGLLRPPALATTPARAGFRLGVAMPPGGVVPGLPLGAPVPPPPASGGLGPSSSGGHAGVAAFFASPSGSLGSGCVGGAVSRSRGGPCPSLSSLRGGGSGGGVQWEGECVVSASEWLLLGGLPTFIDQVLFGPLAEPGPPQSLTGI